MKYATVQALEGAFAVGLMCRCLGVSRGGYHQWKQRPPSLRQQSRQALEAEVKRVFDGERGRAGSPRIAGRPKDEGRKASRNTAAGIMKSRGLRAKAAKKFKATTHSNHSLPVAPNRLGQDFEAAAPDQKWVSDITHVWTDEGWLYLAVVLGLFPRRVVGWAMAGRMAASLVCAP